MIAILLLAVAYVIYWIFMYDSWYPNSIIADTHLSESTHGSFISDGGVDRKDKKS
jgi:hypothetical protein